VDKFTEYLSVKIGIIVAGVIVALYWHFNWSMMSVFVVALTVSLGLWLSVWDFAAHSQFSAYKRRMIFSIHVAASVIPSAIAILYVTSINRLVE